MVTIEMFLIFRVLMLVIALLSLEVSSFTINSLVRTMIGHEYRYSPKYASQLYMTEVSENEASIKSKLAADMKDAMKNKQKVRLTAIRSLISAIKQAEIDNQKDLSNEAAITIMAKIVKQRKESILSYKDAGRSDLAESEEEELEVISSYMPKPLSADELEQMISEAILRLGAVNIKDMSKVMSDLRPKILGRADIADVGASIKSKLASK